MTDPIEQAGAVEDAGPGTTGGATAGTAAAAAVSAAATTTDGAAPGVTELSSDPARGNRKVREGYVVSDKMDKTVVVALQDRKRHPRYAKILRSTTKVKVHDEANEAGVGDRVLLMETRPLSATKRWRLVQVLERAK